MPGKSSKGTVVGEHDKDFLYKGIQAAISRARLNCNALEAIATALRHKECNVAEARQWLDDEGLTALVARYTPRGSSS
jgi:hypothetical protein